MSRVMIVLFLTLTVATLTSSHRYRFMGMRPQRPAVPSANQLAPFFSFVESRVPGILNAFANIASRFPYYMRRSMTFQLLARAIMQAQAQAQQQQPPQVPQNPLPLEPPQPQQPQQPQPQQPQQQQEPAIQLG
ncbi:alpha/beta-gliadin-like [Gigantopelta aegis]|uniref:alpha/beta-gliadin-like n=1 Tax=Gigantopelta aegis TaxID=1735272 RepID=UPI001B889D93|nr:alpha/beta-gliadin-like [Gigantopelta aegis]